MKRLILISLLAPALFAQCVWKTIPGTRQRYQDCATAADGVTGASALTTPGALTKTGATAGTVAESGLRDDGSVIDLLCSGDITTALQSAINTLAAASGGTVRLSSGSCYVTALDTLPNDGATPPTQKSLRITGAGGSANGLWTALPTGGTTLDLRENDAVAKIDTRGAGFLEIDHLTLVDTQSDCAVFVQSTNTTVVIHDNAFSGTASATSACNDAIVLGGTTTTVDGLSTGAFQGYGSVIEKNFFDKIRRGVYFRTYANGVVFRDNTWSTSSGSNLTTTISAATNAAAAVLTMAGHGFAVGTTPSVTISGATGSWTPINGTHVVTPIDVDTFSIAVDSTAFGALTGSPAYLAGAAIEIDGGASTASGGLISGNLVEQNAYPYAVKATKAVEFVFSANSFYDPTTTTLAHYRFESTGQYNTVISGFHSDSVPIQSPTVTSNTILNGHQAQTTVFPQYVKFSNHPVLFDAYGPYQVDSSGNQVYSYLAGDTNYFGYCPLGVSCENMMSMTWNATNDYTFSLRGSARNRFLAPNGDLEIYTKTNSALWFGDSSKYCYVAAGILRCDYGFNVGSGGEKFSVDANGKASATPGGTVPAWKLLQLAGVANGVGDCATAAGCWSVNGGASVPQTAGLTQDVVLQALPAKAQVSDWRIKTNTACTGATTANVGLGTTASNVLFRAQTYDIGAAVSDTNLTTGPTAGAGSNTAAATNLVASLITTVENVDAIADTCKVDIWVLYGVLP